MRQRIRVAALLPQDDAILLVRHDSRYHGTHWVPPGGGLDGIETIEHCARREVREETGLDVDLVRIAYIQQFIERDTDTHHIEVFFLAANPRGRLTMDNMKGVADEGLVREARYVPRNELASITVYPEMLKGGFWDDLRGGFAATRYLGIRFSK